jgi:predicted NAD-dependent protein-ADP-ribosyltransferase YbiA (DUF1768 family)
MRRHDEASRWLEHQLRLKGSVVLCRLVDGWNEWGRYDAMEKIIAAKFAPNTTFAALLAATGDTILIEGNKWHDNTWGICYCGVCRNGHNLLGWILMRQRAKLNQTRFSVYA